MSHVRVQITKTPAARSYFSETNSVSLPERYSKSEKGRGFDILFMRRISFSLSLSSPVRSFLVWDNTEKREFHWNVAHDTFCWDVPSFGWKFAAVFTLTITSFTLIGYYKNHYVNSSPLNWKQYRSVSEETKQKTMTTDLKTNYDAVTNTSDVERTKNRRKQNFEDGANNMPHGYLTKQLEQ